MTALWVAARRLSYGYGMRFALHVGEGPARLGGGYYRPCKSEGEAICLREVRRWRNQILTITGTRSTHATSMRKLLPGRCRRRGSRFFCRFTRPTTGGKTASSRSHCHFSLATSFSEVVSIAGFKS